MSNPLLLKDTSCRISCGNKKGTGFFVTKKLVLTAFHVVKPANILSKEIALFTHTGKNSKGKLFDFDDDLDLALIEVGEDFENDDCLELCECQMVEGVVWNAYGYPDNMMGQAAGEPLNGKIKNVLAVPAHQNDVTVEVPGFNVETVVFEGFSGTAMVDEYENVISIMRFSGTNDLSGISIKRACSFLKKHNLIVKPDYLFNFEAYELEAFAGFPTISKTICNDTAEQVTEGITPGVLVTTFGGNLFFPEKKFNDDNELIGHLRKNMALNRALWTGWLEFLTFVAMLNGKCDFPDIIVTVSAGKIVTPVPVSLKYHWTEKDAFDQVVRRYIHKKYIDGLPSNSCHIFNSEVRYFGIKLKPGFKNNIVQNIAGSEQSGPTVLRKFDFGMLSLKEMAEEVAQSQTLDETYQRLTNLFKNAIEQN